MNLRPDIEMLHIELTSRCNAACPMCARTSPDGKSLFNTSSLNLQWFKDNLPPDNIKQLKKVLFCGALGDPAVCQEILDIIRYLKSQNSNLVIGVNTNGGVRKSDFWSELARLQTHELDYVVFSIDGLEDTNHLYRRFVRWDLLMRNVTSFIESGGKAHWDMLVFKHNKHQVQECEKLAKDMGFLWFRKKETDRWDDYKDLSLYPASEYIEPDYDNITEIDCEREREKSMYIDANGKLWPCCHIAEKHFDVVNAEKHQDIKNLSREEIMETWRAKLETDPFYVCKRSCGLACSKKQQWKSETQLK